MFKQRTDRTAGQREQLLEQRCVRKLKSAVTFLFAARQKQSVKLSAAIRSNSSVDKVGAVALMALALGVALAASTTSALADELLGWG